jgi:hypothetical protein
VSSKQSNFFFGLFRKTKKHFFRFVSVFRTGIETTKTNRTLSKQTETNQKNLQKTFFIRGSSKQLNFFLDSNRSKPKLNLYWLFFVFLRNPPKLFQFVSVFQTDIETTETNRAYGMGNKKGSYFNKFAAVLVSL